jgi:hypothetical protein
MATKSPALQKTIDKLKACLQQIEDNNAILKERFPTTRPILEEDASGAAIRAFARRSGKVNATAISRDACLGRVAKLFRSE